MPFSSKKIVLLGVLIIYGLILFFILHLQLRLDFTSFYSATLAYIHDINPYKSLTTEWFNAIPSKLPINLNPPFFLLLMTPITFFNLKIAASIWFIGSLILGSIGALLSFKLTCPERDYQKYWSVFLCIYLMLYSTLMNASIGQIGGGLLFFIMAGYYFYLKKQDYAAGVFWGIIIAIKFFPGLLFLFVVQQNRYKVFGIMLLTVFVASLMPLLIKGSAIYSIYFNMLPHVLWFGDNWNGSLYGFLFRLFVHGKAVEHLWLIKIIYLCLFMIALLWYIKKINRFSAISNDHRSFCLTLVMMLLLSPMGWLYYFSLLIMPLILIWQSLNINPKYPVLWGLSLFLINFPVGYIEAKPMNSVLSQLSIYSIYFYGLILITYLISSLRDAPPMIEINNQHQLNSLFPLKASLTLGFFVISSSILIHLMS